MNRILRSASALLLSVSAGTFAIPSQAHGGLTILYSSHDNGRYAHLGGYRYSHDHYDYRPHYRHHHRGHGHKHGHGHGHHHKHGKHHKHKPHYACRHGDRYGYHHRDHGRKHDRYHGDDRHRGHDRHSDRRHGGYARIQRY